MGTAMKESMVAAPITVPQEAEGGVRLVAAPWPQELRVELVD